MAQSRGWCFTLNNPSQEDVDSLLNRDKHKYQYLVYQQEVGAECKTPHLQGLLYFYKKCRLERVKKIVPRAHLEAMRGTPDQAIAYCKKDDTRAPNTEPVEIGEAPEMGARSDLKKLMDEVKEGNHDKLALAEKYGPTYLRIYKGVDHLIQMQKESRPPPFVRRQKPPCMVFFGPTGVGKTWNVEEYAISQQLSLWQLNNEQLRKGWFTGYCGHEVVSFEEFRGQTMQPYELMAYLDNKTGLVPIKGGQVKFEPKQIFITTDTHPINWFCCLGIH